MLNRIKQFLGLPGAKDNLKKEILSHTKGTKINVLEAGASGGEDTLEWSGLIKGNLYAFEPVAQSYDKLTASVRHRKNVKTFNFALSDKPGTADIYISQNDNIPDGLASSSSLLKPDEHVNFHPHISFDQKQTIQVRTIDEWAAEQGVDRIEVMWLDMQGGEMNALKGAKKVLQNTQVIYSEVSLKPMYKDAPLYPEFRDFMSGLGFEVVKEYLDWEDMGNVIFVKR